MRSVVVAAVAAGVLTASALAASALGASSAGGADSAALLVRYAPVLKLYASDRKPSAVEPYLAGSDLESPSGSVWRVVRKSPPASALVNGSKQLRLDLRGCSPATSSPTCYRVQAALPTVYGRIWRGSGTFENATILQYWLFYPLNDWRNSRTKPTVWYLHEGDWEEVSVQLSPAGKPISVALSQHNLGVNRTWALAPREGTHPVVYVALGSHANYFSPGFHGVATIPHVVPIRFSGFPLPGPDFTSAQAMVRAPAVVDVTGGAPWLSFAGTWGDGSYVLVRKRSTSQGYTRLRIGDSPIGPAFHAIWRDPMQQFTTWPADDGH
jgi:hypothetical protein